MCCSARSPRHRSRLLRKLEALLALESQVAVAAIPIIAAFCQVGGRMRHRLLLALSLSVCTAVNAETAYVTDSLRLGIHAASDTSDRPFDSLISGTPMEVLERNTNYARVRLTDGREGWVKAMYLETEKPPAARILELEGEVASMTSGVAAAKAAQARAEQELGKL